MKKVLMLIVLLGILFAFATVQAAPVVGISIEPAVGSTASYVFGWQSIDWAAIVTKDSLSSWSGDWSIAGLWTPSLWTEKTQLRVGPQINLTWDTSGITYDGLSLILGVQTWSAMVGVYGQLVLSSSYELYPEVGIEIQFYQTPTSESSG